MSLVKSVSFVFVCDCQSQGRTRPPIHARTHIINYPFFFSPASRLIGYLAERWQHLFIKFNEEQADERSQEQGLSFFGLWFSTSCGKFWDAVKGTRTERRDFIACWDRTLCKTKTYHKAVTRLRGTRDKMRLWKEGVKKMFDREQTQNLHTLALLCHDDLKTYCLETIS